MVPQIGESCQFGALWLARRRSAPQGGRMEARSPIEDRQRAARAWARFRRVMRWMLLLTVTMVAGAMVAHYRQTGLVPPHFYIAAALGLGLVMLLAAGLMGLAFLAGGKGAEGNRDAEG